MSKRKSSSGGCLWQCIKWTFMLCLWPITLTVYILSRQKKKESEQKAEQERAEAIRLIVEESRPDYTQSLENQRMSTEQYFEESSRINYTRQLNETLKILEETNNISTFFSRLSFLRQLRKNILDYGSGDLSDLVNTIEDHLDMREEHINLFLLKRFNETEEKVAGSSPAVVQRSYKALYNRFDGYKSRMCEENIRMYTERCQQRMGVDVLNLPTYSKILTRLNNSIPNTSIPPEYYAGMFGSTSETVQFLKQKGYLTTTEDNKKYILTDLGREEVGWL